MQDDDPTIERDASADTSRGTLRVITAADQEPFSFYKNGEIVGYDVELATRIAEKMGYDVEFTNAEFTSLFPAIQSDKYDMAIGCITITEERRESVLFSDSVYDGGTVAVLYDGTAVEEGSFLSDLKSSFQRTFITENRWQLIVNGLIVTVKISVAALIAGSILGFFYSMVLRSRNRLIRGAGNALSTLLDGMPLLITLMIFYYIIFNKTSLSAMVIAVLAFSLDFANVVAGLLNTGISAVDPGQLEAAEAMGYPKWQIFTKITFPQAAKQMAGQFNGAVIGLIKGTSVVGYITIQDLTKAGDLIRSRTYEAFFPLIVVAVIYFLIAHIFIAIIKQFEKKLDPKRRPRKVKGVITND
jgi:polar amino acid transport system substrate-binding protein